MPLLYWHKLYKLKSLQKFRWRLFPRTVYAAFAYHLSRLFQLAYWSDMIMTRLYGAILT